MSTNKTYIHLDVEANMEEVCRISARNPTAAALKAVTFYKSQHSNELPDKVAIVDEHKTKMFIYSPESFMKTTSGTQRSAVRVQRTQYINLMEEKAKWMQSKSELQIWQQ